ncbi:hypothetical protein CDAR_438051 [Caerostris darwini]|uniref:Uncharacterized protein n=1 Tax=Caerostris darwini TaxID=1538125 RepID=A0AAV4TCH0_9ARAC|nr:hypothetical protein CDAR_438051 [Caerostris darwini]
MRIFQNNFSNQLSRTNGRHLRRKSFFPSLQLDRFLFFAQQKTSPSSLLPPVPAISTTAFICSTTSTRHLNSSPTASILPALPSNLLLQQGLPHMNTHLLNYIVIINSLTSMNLINHELYYPKQSRTLHASVISYL